MTDIKEPINTTSDGTFLSVVCENPEKKVLLAKSWGAQPPPPPPPTQELPPWNINKLKGVGLRSSILSLIDAFSSFNGGISKYKRFLELAKSTHLFVRSDALKIFPTCELADPFPFITWRRERVWPTAIELPVLAFTQGQSDIGCPLTSNQLTLTLPWVKARTGSTMAVGQTLSLLHVIKGKGSAFLRTVSV